MMFDQRVVGGVAVVVHTFNMSTRDLNYAVTGPVLTWQRAVVYMTT